MIYIKKIQIEDTIYEANVDFRNIIKCNEIANDENIGNYERFLAIIYLVFGDKGLDNSKHHTKLKNWLLKYLSCDQEIKDSKEQPDMDYVEDMDYIEASFMSDYRIDLTETKMDWQKFNKLINGLSNSELGNCCILNRIRNLRNLDPSTIKDNKERDKVIKQKEMFALKKYKKENHLTKEQEESMERLNKIIGL